MSTYPRLLARPAPYESESFMGYLLRLAEINYYSTPFNIVKAGLENEPEKANVNDYVKLLSSGDIDLLGFSELTQESVDTLESLRYPIVLASADHQPDIHEFFYYDVPSNFLRFAYPKVCVECLRESSYHRSIWDFAPLTCCPEHDVLLVDYCIECNSQLTWNRKGVRYCQCGFDLTRINPIKVDHNQNWLSKEIQYLLNYTSDDKRLIISDETSTRRFDDLIDLINLINDKSYKLADSKRKHYRYELQWQPNYALHKTLMFTVCNLDTGPYLSPYFIPVSNKNSLARAVGLKNIYSNKTIDQKIFYLQSDYLYRQTSTIVKSDLCACLKISKTLLHSMELQGVLLPVSGPPIDSSGDYHYSLKHVSQILDNLSANSISDVEDPITIGEHLKTCSVANKRPFGMLISSMLDGKVQFVIKASAHGLLDIELSKKSLKAFINRTCKRKHDQAYISVDQAAKKLKTYPAVIYSTLDKLIPCINLSNRKFIHIKDVVEFHENYVLISELAKDCETNPTNLSEKIIDEGISPVSGPLCDGNKVYIFKRSDIRRLDMLSVVNKKKYDTNTGRKPKRTHRAYYQTLIEDLSLLTSTEAAKFLNISSQKLAILIKKNYIKLERNPELPVSKKYIRLSQLRTYRIRYLNNPYLMSFNKASNSLNESTTRFYYNWIKSRRLKVIKDGLGNEYVDFKQLVKIKKFKEKALSGADAAELLGVEKYVINNLRKQSKLRPISGPGIDDFKNYFYKRQDIETLSHENWW
ncbi:TniQ family protein [uncultured Methylophaga sp.]|uniref:TniQ family protein n=1 Tax=uncultured Methylophaga sp. TaxID=285271 RepID=UPI00262469E0|nr:TniQ family protein [uncultured Methylophaga sp.]